MKFKKSVKQKSVHVSEEASFEPCSTEELRENALLSSSETVLMQTARSEIKHPTHNHGQNVRILLDSGSKRTYITERLANYLHLEKESEQDIRLFTFGSEKSKVLKTSCTEVSLKLKQGGEIDLTVNIVPNIAGTIQRRPLSISDRSNFNALVENLSLADTILTETETDTIDLLIGSDYCLDIIMGHKIEVQTGLYLLSSKLVWLLTGRSRKIHLEADDLSMPIPTYGNSITTTEAFTTVDKSIPDIPDLEDFWNIETI